MSKARKKSAACLNCQTPLRPADNYCPNCGQENKTNIIPVSHLVFEVFEDIFHFDTKLWNTLKTSFTRPGKITLDYLEGKRASYVPPVKLYVFVSFIFFLLVGKQGDHAIDTLHKSAGTVQFELSTMNLTINELQGGKRLHSFKYPNDIQMIGFDFTSSDSLRTELTHLKQASDAEIDNLLLEQNIDTTAKSRERLRNALVLIPAHSLALDTARPNYGLFNKVRFNSKAEYERFKKNIPYYSPEQMDSLLLSKGEKASWFNRQLVKKLGTFDIKNPEDMKQLTHAIIKSISLTMFIMMPMTALLLLWIFYRRKYYYEHLVFSIHIHTIFFILLSLILTIQIFISESFGEKLWPYAFMLCMIYLVASLKHNYKQTWGRTIFKFILMSIPYLFISLILAILAVAYGFIM